MSYLGAGRRLGKENNNKETAIAILFKTIFKEANSTGFIFLRKNV